MKRERNALAQGSWLAASRERQRARIDLHPRVRILAVVPPELAKCVKFRLLVNREHSKRRFEGSTATGEFR